MIKVLHVIRSLDRAVGGPVVGLSRLVSAQNASKSIVPSIFAAQTERDHFIQRYDCSVNVIKVEDLPLRANNNFRFFYDKNKILQNLIFNADIIHLHMAWDYVVLKAVDLAHRLNKPVILRPCGSFEEWSMGQKAYKKKLYLNSIGKKLNSVSALHFTTSFEDRHSSITQNWKANRYTIPIGIEKNSVMGGQSVKIKNLQDNKIKILFLGRLNYKKQPEKVLYTLKFLLENSKNEFSVRFVGHGDGDYIGSLIALSKRLGVENAVTFAGPADSVQVTQELRDAHVFILPSLQENLSIATIEAMSHGLPVVISDRVAIHQDVSIYEAGRVVPFGQAHYGKEVLDMFSERDLYGRMCENAVRLVSDKFSINENCKDILHMYRDVLTR